MLRLIARRLLLSIPLVALVTALTFALQSLTPGDAARTILGTQFDPARYAQLRRQLGLDQPVTAQYWRWLRHVLHGSLGESIYSGQSVVSVLNGRLGVTVSLIVGATIVSGLAGVGLGVASAVRAGGLLGRVVDVISLVGSALPGFWLGLVLVSLFAVALPIFPATGYVPIGASVSDWASSLVLPVVTLAVGGVAVIAKQTRAAMLDVLQREFVWALRARGIGEATIVFRHALRSAAIPVVTVVGLLFVAMLTGTVLVETVFALPGLGSVAVQASSQHDLPLLQGVTVYFTLIIVAVNLLIDIAYGWLNPKVRTR